MKICQILGDLTSEKSSENYPTVPVCDECVEANRQQSEDDDQVILSAAPYDPTFGDTCELCGKTLAEERG